MEISVTSASLNTATSLEARSLYGASRPAERADESSRIHEHHHHRGHKSNREMALQVFRQELRSALRVQFRTELSAGQDAYAANQEPAGPDDVADEALGVAKQVVAQSPTTAAKSLIEFRSHVRESVQVTQKTVGSEDDMADVDQAVAKLDDGLNQMEEEAASTRVSTASALEVDTRTKQRSSIMIRTQEGDVVKLSLRQFSEMSASGSQSVEGNTASSETEIEFSSRSRIVMKVRGDLNEAEMGAIQGVLGQAQEMADAFFGGDIGAAFSAAGGFTFDNEQLANVNMRFSMRQVSNISYTQTVGPTALPQNPAPEVAPAPATEPVPAVATESPKPEPVAPVEAPVDEAPAVEEPDAATKPTIPGDALSGFFEMVGSFLRSVSEGFEGASANSSIRFQYSESFKLSLLQSVIHTAAPDDAGDAAEAAIEAIEQLKETDE